ncbi:MAG: hypothetical protein CMI32_06015 [Opitutales bacterium]|nr:hypothetical protein [Opitutales bacterium]
MKSSLWFAAFSMASVSVLAEDWPTWRGPRGDGSWQAPKLATSWPEEGLRRIWKKPVSPGYSGVSVADGKVYLMDRPDKEIHGEKERVLCLAADTGKELWTFSYDSPYGDLDHGTGPRATITIHNGKAYGLGAVGHAFCLDAKTGKALWFRDLAKEEMTKRPIWGYAGSPLVHGEWMLYQIGARPTGCVVALDAASGKTAWRSGDELAGYGPPVIIRRGERTEMICWGPENVVGLPVGNGKELWEIPYKVKYGVAIATPIYREGIVLVCGYWNGSKAIRLGSKPGDATLLWEDEEALCGLMSQPLYRDGFCYLLDRRHGLTCFELKTGKIRWRDEHQLTPKDRNPQASLVWVGDTNRALALNANGELILCELKPTGYKELERAQVTGKTWAHPAYSGNRVYARNDREIVCYELPVR